MSGLRIASCGGDLEAARLYLENRFPMNTKQRLEVGKSGSVPIPQFVLIRTRLGCLWRFRADLAATPIRGLAKLAGREGNVVDPIVAAAPPERVEPMLRVLDRAGFKLAVMRELLVRRAGWIPEAELATIQCFRIDAEERMPFQTRSKAGLANAQMGSIAWTQRRALQQLDPSQWICFADLTQWIDIPA